VRSASALAVGGEGAEAADVHVPQVAGRLAGGDPFGDQPPGAAAVGDAGRIEAGADVVAAQLGASPRMKLPSGVKLSGPLSSILIFAVSRQGVRWMALVISGSNWSQSSSSSWNWKRAGDRVHAPGLGHRLEAAHQQAADLFLVVDEAVGVAHHRQHRVHAVDAVGDDVEVLGREQRHVDAGQRAELPRPLAGAVDQRLAAHLALTQCARRPRGPRSMVTPVTSTPSTSLAPPLRAPLGQRHAQVGRVGLAVAGDPDRPAGRRCASPGKGHRPPSG
jgi:hypothetical protein